jgi:UDP-N-acetylglucosamine transferase subunit ALG13
MRDVSIFVTVGTDHHPFDRLVRWADELALAHPDATVTVQFGTSTAPRVAEGVSAVPHEDMLRRMGAASVVVAQGGPGGIMDSRVSGRLPIVVPRDPSLGEHVDDHQQRFSQHMRDRGRIALALDQITFRALVARALSHPEEFVVGAENSPTATTAARVEAALVGLVPHAQLPELVPAPRLRLRGRRAVSRVTPPDPVGEKAATP